VKKSRCFVYLQYPPSFASVQVFLSVALVKLLESIANLFKASIFP